MAEDLSQAQLRQQQAEDRERLDEEWTAIAEERRLLDEDKKKVIEERRRLEDRRRMMEDERRTIEDERMSLQEERQTMIKEREDFDRIRENALSGIDDSVSTLRRAARELTEAGTRGLRNRSSSSSPEGRPDKRPRRTPGGPRMPSEPPAGPTNARNGTDPLGLPSASDEIKNIWRQIEFPQEWTVANSDDLLELFTKRATKKAIPGNRPLAILDRSATRDDCLTARLWKLAPKLDNGPTLPCSVCRDKGWACIAVDFTEAGDDNEPYDEDGQGMRWKVSIRKD